MAKTRTGRTIGGGSRENWEAKTSGRRKGGGSGENQRTNENDDYTT